ncbi:hypothetical protein HY971_02900 [Candidatus Kaiserbacteria bacterium]|nr:hypothetical protein [Candidatus Kaiserbacteria bacterium]
MTLCMKEVGMATDHGHIDQMAATDRRRQAFETERPVGTRVTERSSDERTGTTLIVVPPEDRRRHNP